MTRSLLSIVIPAYNEAARLPGTLSTLSDFLRAHEPHAEVIVVDDGSADGTGAAIDHAADREARIRGVRAERRRGKGAAVARGVSEARGEIVLFFDADLSYPLDMIATARTALEQGADLAIGARDPHAIGDALGYDRQRRVATRVFNAIVEQTLHLGITDTQCGFKAFRAPVARALFDALTIDGFAFDVELLYLARRWGLTITRLPIAMRHHDGSTVRVAADGLRMLRDIASVRLRALAGLYPASLPRR